MAGVTAQGFTPKLLADILTEIETDEKTLLDPNIDTSADQPLGQLNGIFANKLAQLWELANVAYNQFNRGAVEGVQLDNVGALTGTSRDPQTFTVVNATLNIDAGDTVPADSKVKVAGTNGPFFDLEADVTNSGGSPANLPGVFVCETAGPIIVNSGTLTDIVTPVTGWNSVTNATDGTPGTNVETDTAYRLRQVEDLAALGSCDLDSIVEAVAKVAGVIQVIGFENTTLTTDVNGLPGKSFCIVVWDGASPAASNTDIATAIWENKPSGILAYGSTSTTITDAQGISRTISFTRATQVPIYMTFDIKIVTGYAGDQALKDAVETAFNARQLIGTSVIHAFYQSVPFSLTGVTDVTHLFQDSFPTPVDETNLLLSSPFQIATLSETNIVINHV